jgi:hypothetical protein
MAGAPIRRARRIARDKVMREQAVRDYLGPNGKNLFPGIEDHVNEPIDASAAMPALPVPESPAQKQLPEQLSRAADLAVKDAIETLEMKVDRLDPNFIKIKQLKAQAGATVAGILARVSPQDMKGRANDKVGDILAALRSAPQQ